MAGLSLPVQQKLLAASLIGAGKSMPTVAKESGVSVGTVFNISKDSKSALVQAVAEGAVKSQLEKELKGLSARIRSTLAGTIGKQVNTLASSPKLDKVDELRNTPKRQGLAAVAQTLASAASTVCGWDRETMAETLTDARSVIDVDAIVQAASEPAQIVDQPVNNEKTPQ